MSAHAAKVPHSQNETHDWKNTNVNLLFCRDTSSSHFSSQAAVNEMIISPTEATYLQTILQLVWNVALLGHVVPNKSHTSWKDPVIAVLKV